MMRDLTLSTETDVGRSMLGFMEELFPICRSITGDGLRETLRRIGDRIPLEIREVPSGTRVLDWTIPSEWNVRDAYIKDSRGRRVVDFRDHNLHVVGYSTPVSGHFTLSEIREHIHTLPQHPTWIPYRTSYYTEGWGFCMEHERLDRLTDEEEYEVLIDSSLEDGSLSYGECYLPGEIEAEFLISCHCCHPSLANDNLSGIALTTQLAEHLGRLPHRFSYRFLFIPGTIGSIAWLAANEERVSRIEHGLVVTCVGDRGHLTYKRSRRGDAEVDRAVQHVLRTSELPHRIVDFVPYGYDERQYCSPGFDLPVGSLMRTPNAEYPEYHTSADDLTFVSEASLVESLQTYVSVIDLLENNRRFRNISPKGEPQLGRRGLYPPIGGTGPGDELLARLWVLNLSDGSHSLLDVAERAGLPFGLIRDAAAALEEGGLLSPAPMEGVPGPS